MHLLLSPLVIASRTHFFRRANSWLVYVTMRPLSLRLVVACRSLPAG